MSSSSDDSSLSLNVSSLIESDDDQIKEKNVCVDSS